jgi:hypothetical protein
VHGNVPIVAAGKQYVGSAVSRLGKRGIHYASDVMQGMSILEAWSRCRGNLDIESDRKRSSRTLEPLYLVETFEHSVHIMGMH